LISNELARVNKVTLLSICNVRQISRVTISQTTYGSKHEFARRRRNDNRILRNYMYIHEERFFAEMECSHRATNSRIFPFTPRPSHRKLKIPSTKYA